MTNLNVSQTQPAERKPWKVQRAYIISPPQEIKIGHLGCTTFATVVMKNGTNWPLKEGCALQSYFTGHAKECLKEVNIPLDSYIDANKEFTLKIPLHVKCSAMYSIETNEKVHQAEFYIQGPRGSPFGDKIVIPIKIVEKIDESEIY